MSPAHAAWATCGRPEAALPFRHRLAITFILAIAMLVPSHASSAAAPPGDWGTVQLLERVIAPGEKRKFSYQLSRTFEGSFLDTAVFVARGARSGPTLCVTALIHGDERNGFEIARQVFAATDPALLAGTLIALPAANVHGFRTGSRYMPDRRDLNRAFPGSTGTSNTALIAAIVFGTLREQCTALVDLHTGSFERANLPQVRVDLARPEALDLARHFGAAVVIGGAGPQGSLRREMMDAGIPAIIYEAGLPMRFEPQEIAAGVQGIRNVMIRLGMTAGQATAPTPPARIFSRSGWVRVPVGQGGVFYPVRGLGEDIRTGEIIARIHEPFTDERFDVPSSRDGFIVGAAVPQVVFSGYALVHIAQP
ncbi:MAG: succinylglutamate desuccinylase/aspartoacylase family protein [Gammaproteobacteria bacterium]|nr:succinylglutamate desuccinylase/aspartoacylase family protein [Gammaproteobacteria bacterium]